MLKTNYVELDCGERLTKARVNLNRGQPFFANLLMRFKFIESEDVPLAGVDVKKNIYYNPKGILELQEKQLMGLLVHEALHWILLHHLRSNHRNLDLWNIATDSTINYLIKEQRLELPRGGIVSDWNNEITLNINGKKVVYKIVNDKGDVRSAEDIYQEIYKQVPKRTGGKSGSDQKEKSGEITDVSGNKVGPIDTHIFKDKKGKSRSEQEEKDIMKEVKQRVSEANMYAKSRGSTPLGLKRWIEELLEPKINWKAELYQYIQKRTSGISDWKRPHRRSHSIGTYLPRRQSDKIHTIFHIDTSGSMGGDDLKQSLTELQELLRTFKEVHIDVLVGDSEIQETFELTQNNKEDILSIVKGLKGGGGTSHVPVFKKVETMENAKILICFTDGYTDFPRSFEDFSFSTLWLLTEHSCDEDSIPFGKVIKIDSTN